MATFRQATATVLARSAPQGAFDVRAPRALEEATTALADAEREEATTAPEDAEGEAVSLTCCLNYDWLGVFLIGRA